MNATNSPVDAIAPAVEHVRRVLFRPFDLGKWFTGGYRVPGKPVPQGPAQREDDEQ